MNEREQMEKKQNKRMNLICIFTLVILSIATDQISKLYIQINLSNKHSYSLIEGVVEFFYWENYGAAFGILNGQRIFFIFLGTVLLILIILMIIKFPFDQKYNKLRIALTFIGSGTMGNLIDRIRLGYVVDFIYFSGIHFPIFNIADIIITAASIYLIILFLFVYKEKDLEFLSFRIKKYREM